MHGEVSHPEDLLDQLDLLLHQLAQEAALLLLLQAVLALAVVRVAVVLSAEGTRDRAIGTQRAAGSLLRPTHVASQGGNLVW